MYLALLLFPSIATDYHGTSHITHARVRQDEKILGIVMPVLCLIGFPISGIVRAAEGQVFRFPLTLRLL